MFDAEVSVKPVAIQDSIFVLKELLALQTGLNPVKIMLNTAGASDIVFSLLRLPGSQFSPQLDSALKLCTVHALDLILSL